MCLKQDPLGHPYTAQCAELSLHMGQCPTRMDLAHLPAATPTVTNNGEKIDEIN